MCGKEDFPEAYVNGFADFYYERYKVPEGVLIPRPDTELLVEAALAVCGALDNPMGDVAKVVPLVSSGSEPQFSQSLEMADLCTGTGCVGISVSNALVRAGHKVFCELVDVSDVAVKCASSNLDVALGDVKVRKLDILSEDFESRLGGGFSVITSNPPYITDNEMKELPQSVRYEPELALRGGEDGLVFYRRLCKIAQKCLASGGWLLVEHGYLQQEDVMKIFNENGFCNVTGLRDFGGNPRVVLGMWRI